MAAPTVYDHVAEGANLGGQLFAGKLFWVAQRVPARNSYLEKIRSNGGEVTQLEKKADYLIADHLRRKDCPPGSLSYTFVDESLKNGAIEDPDGHLAGPPIGSAREAGASSKPSRSVRAAYTAEEDRILYKWVRDHERAGGMPKGTASGNELYKQLEQQYPRHTWQSWRDRYLKKLRYHPPAGLSIPANAPPSPPSDQPAEPLSPASRQPREKQKSPVERQNNTPETARGNAHAKERYSRDDLELMFQLSDWEELYANADTIFSIGGTPSYEESWVNWAEQDKGRRTAEQWKQYFERIVWPRYEDDSPFQRSVIQKRVWKRHEEDIEQSSDASEQSETRERTQPQIKATGISLPKSNSTFEPLVAKAMAERKGIKQAQDAYTFWVLATKDAGAIDQVDLKGDLIHLRKVLLPRWNKLSNEVRKPYYALEVADKQRIKSEKSEHREQSERDSSPEVPSSSTLIQHTPSFVTKAYAKVMKRMRSIENDFEESESPSRPSKSRRIHPSSTLAVGKNHQPVRPSPPGGSSFSADEESNGEEDEDLDRASAKFPIQYHSHKETTSSEVLHSGNDRGFPDDTPATTPRAFRFKAHLADTQAILSSPPGSLSIKPLPKPSSLDSQEPLSSPSLSPTIAPLPLPDDDDIPDIKEEPLSRSPSLSVQTFPLGALGSEASTTLSMQEFRRSFNNRTSPEKMTDSNTRAPISSRESPAPSEGSSQGSGDPDPPLNPEELEEFFAEQHEEGFADNEITAALKHTRCRPELAVQVLDAWKEYQPLPVSRGIWSTSDDEDVISGAPDKLERLVNKHSLDGWGGVTERKRFLVRTGKMKQKE